MTELERKSGEFADGVMKQYASIFWLGSAKEMRLVLQKVYLEGYGAGMKDGYEIGMNVVERVLGGK